MRPPCTQVKSTPMHSLLKIYGTVQVQYCDPGQCKIVRFVCVRLLGSNMQVCVRVKF
eukprot:SAG22_NODE_3990_length_1434_cov_2.810487_1_plen_56_part_10